VPVPVAHAKCFTPAGITAKLPAIISCPADSSTFIVYCEVPEGDGNLISVFGTQDDLPRSFSTHAMMSAGRSPP
jgi:hypothetical protein